MRRHSSGKNRSFFYLSALAALAVAAGCVDTAEQEAMIPSDEAATAAPLPEEQAKRHCNVPVTADRKGEPESKEASTPDAAAVECFDTFAESIYSATKGALKLPADATPASLAKLSDGERALAGTFLISVEYIAPRWDGFWGSRNFTSTVNCDMGYRLSFADLASIGWGDRISSVYTSPGCAHGYHYDYANFGGAVLDCTPAVNGHDPCYYNLGALDDRSSSIRWTN
jgi:hypothetical protein